jgi:hypothetical protein
MPSAIIVSPSGKKELEGKGNALNGKRVAGIGNALDAFLGTNRNISPLSFLKCDIKLQKYLETIPSESLLWEKMDEEPISIPEDGFETGKCVLVIDTTEGTVVEAYLVQND